MRVCLTVVALAVAVWMAVLAHSSEAAAPAAHNLSELQGGVLDEHSLVSTCLNAVRHCGRDS